MSAAAPNTEFVIYNIPQLAGTGLTMSLLREMLKNPNVVAVKNSSMPTQDIQMFKDAGIAARGEGNFVVFNGPDEQFVSGRVIGADGGIDFAKFRPIAFEPAHSAYHVLGEKVGDAFRDGGKLK